MENTEFLRNGAAKLPPGFRFHPTDEELVVHYLRRKALSYPLPASIIPDVDLEKFDPWDLPGDREQERYFFKLNEAKCPAGGRVNRAARSGYWKATGRDKPIRSSMCKEMIVGKKKVLVFYQGKPPRGCKTDWIMHEYRLLGTALPTDVASRNWVLCRIFVKRRAANRVGLIDCFGRGRDGAAAAEAGSESESSASSCVTDSSDQEEEEEEEENSRLGIPSK